MENKVVSPYVPTKALNGQETERAELAQRFAQSDDERKQIRRDAQIEQLKQKVAELESGMKNRTQ